MDSVHEMMTSKQYCHWMHKPKNGGKDMEESRIEYINKFKTALVKDKLGTDGVDRMAIKIKDLLTFRDANIKSRGYDISERQKKGATQV